MNPEEIFFKSPGPILLDAGFTQIRWYGLLYGVAFLVALFFIQKIARKRIQNKDKEELDEELDVFAISALVSGIVGARLWYVLLSLDYFLLHPSEILQIWLGGQSIQGGIIGAVLGTWVLACIYKKESLDYYLEKLASITVALPMAQAIGRWGNFFNEEAYGSVTDLPWKLYISHTGNFHHPTFLYESIWNLICFFLLLKFHSKLKSKQVIGIYLILYSVARLALEEMRTDSLMLWNLPAASIIASISIITGVVLFSNSHNE